MPQKASSILIGLMELALLAFTASRTLDLLQQILPPSQGIFAFLALVAFDGGLVGWSLFLVYGARGGTQRAIALLMVVLSLAAIGISVVADLLISASARGLVDALPEQGRLAVLVAVGLVVFLNVAAFFLSFISDPDRAKMLATESAKDVITAETLRQIKGAAPGMAAEIAPELTRQWVRSTTRELLPGGQEGGASNGKSSF